PRCAPAQAVGRRRAHAGGAGRVATPDRTRRACGARCASRALVVQVRRAAVVRGARALQRPAVARLGAEVPAVDDDVVVDGRPRPGDRLAPRLALPPYRGLLPGGGLAAGERRLAGAGEGEVVRLGGGLRGEGVD